MDNISYTSSQAEEINNAYIRSFEIFNPYGFDLQKFYTNVPSIQELMDKEAGVPTDVTVDLFGLLWDRNNDHLSCKRLYLNPEANTKRKVLQTLPNMTRSVYTCHY